MNATASPLSITASDQVFATLEAGGRILARLSSINFGSIGEVIDAIYRMAGKFAGIARVSIRNKSQGWSKVMMLSRRVTDTVRPLPFPSVKAPAAKASAASFAQSPRASKAQTTSAISRTPHQCVIPW